MRGAVVRDLREKAIATVHPDHRTPANIKLALRALKRHYKTRQVAASQGAKRA